MARAFIGIGSNIRPQENVPRALAMLRDALGPLRVSPFYRSAPVGTREGGAFWNGVAEANTELPPRDLKDRVLRHVEARLGRRRTDDPNAPRTMDLDILLYDDVVDRAFPLPDPGVTRHAFVAVPLLDLAPDLVVPGAGERLADVVARVDRAGLTRLADDAIA